MTLFSRPIVGVPRPRKDTWLLPSHFLLAESGKGLFTLLYFARKETIAMKEQLTAVFQQVPEGYIGFVEELPGANTQGVTLDEARTNLQEAVQLVLESNHLISHYTRPS